MKSNRRHQLAGLAPFAAAGLVVVGILLLLTGSGTAEYGWFAYAPLPDTVFVPSNGLFLGRGQLVGTALAAVGMLGLAFWAGYRMAGRAAVS